MGEDNDFYSSIRRPSWGGTWRLDLENSRNSLGREGGRAFQAGRTARAKAEGCGSIWCVLESMGIRVHV